MIRCRRFVGWTDAPNSRLESEASARGESGEWQGVSRENRATTTITEDIYKRHGRGPRSSGGTDVGVVARRGSKMREIGIGEIHDTLAASC